MSVIFDKASNERKSVFLVASKAPNLDSPTLFKEKGLAPYAPERPSLLEYYGNRRLCTLGRELYVANIAAILYASYTGVNTPATYNYFSLLGIQFADSLLSLPQIGVSYTSAPTLEVKTMFSRFGFSQQEHRNMIQFFGIGTKDIVQSILETHPNIDCTTPISACNIRGYMAFVTTMRIVQTFLRTNTEAIIKGVDGTQTIAINPTKKPVAFPAYSAARSDGSAWKFDDEDKAWGKTVGAGLSGTDVNVVIRPQISTFQSFGPVAGIPDLPNQLLFSYFDGMQLPDSVEPIHIIDRFFKHNLGTSAEQITSSYSSLRRGWKSLSTTTAGMQLSHLLQGVKLALDTSTAMYPIVENKKYLGFVLCAETPFWVGIRGKVVTSTTATQVKIDVQLSSAHTKALSQICKLVSDAVLKGQDNREILTRAQVKGARQLYNEVHRRSFDKPGLDEIKKWADYLNFDQEYLKVTPATLVQAFEAFSSQAPLPVETPMFLGAGIIVMEQLSVQIMASFGRMAPSLIFQKGESCNLPVPGIDRDESAITDSNGRPFMPFIAIYGKNVRAAASDLEEVFKKRRVLFKRGIKGGAGKNSFQFVGTNKDSIWTGLAAAVSYKATMEAAARGESGGDKKGKKRAADNDGGEGPQTKKVREEENFDLYI